MKPSRVAFPTALLAVLLFACPYAEAQAVLSGGAFGSGGVLTGGGLRLIGSAGQAATGIASGATHTSRAGLYFQVTTAPGLSASTASLSFGEVQVGQSRALTFTVSNTGAAALTVSGITVSGADAAQFTVSPATFTVNAGAAAQTVSVTFAPSSAGSKSATLSVAHNASGSPSPVALTGSGTAQPPPPTPTISLSAFSLTMDATGVGSTSQRTFTVSNTGNASLSITGVTVSGTDASQFTVSPTTATIAAGGSQTITVTFAPTAGGTKSATLSIAHNAPGSPSTLALSGAGSSVDFSVTNTTGRGQLEVRFTLVTQNVLIRSVRWTFGDGETSAEVHPEHLYRAPGVYTVRVDVTTEGGQVLTRTKEGLITVSALAQPGIALSPASLSFGGVRVGSSESRTLTVSNPGAAALTVTLSADSAQFAVSPAQQTINAGDSAKVTLTFRPTSGRPLLASLSIAHNAAGGPAAVRLSGTGLKPALTYQPDRLGFGDVATGVAVQLPVALTNAGNDTLRVDTLRVTSSGAFALVAPRPNLVLVPRDSQVVTVSFRPAAPGDHTGSLTASSNDPDRRGLSIPLSGAGVVLSLSVDLNPAEGNQRQGTAGGVRPGRRVPVQLFIEEAPPIRGFTVRIGFDPRKVAFVRESFSAGPVVPGLIGLTDPKGDYVEVGGTTLGGGTGGGNGLLGTLSFEALAGFEGETTLRVPFVIWDRGTEGRQTIQTDVRGMLTSAGGRPSPDFDGDGEVGFGDFFLFANAFGSSDARFDLDGDGNVGFTDFFLFADAFGKRVG